MYEQKNADRHADMAVLRTFLREGEEVLWTGRPCATVPYRPPLGGVLSSLFVLGFSLFWTATAATASAGFALFGLPFVAMGVFLFYASTFRIKVILKKTLYAVTDRRVLIIRETRRGTDCAEYLFSHLRGADLERVQGSAGSIRLRDGVVYDEPRAYYRIGHRRQAIPTEADVRDVLVMIDNVEVVYRMISEGIGGN